MKCPKCNKDTAENVEIFGSKFLICDECGYDESEELLDEYGGDRKSKSGKSSPYKRGGSMRTVKH